MEILRIVTIVEDVLVEGGRKAEKPTRRVASAAVITNPAVGDKSGENLAQFSGIGRELGTILAKEAMGPLGSGSNVESYGKACIVGAGGELEQAAILIHKEFGQSVRDVIGGGKAGIPSTKKVAAAGATIDVPLSFRDNSGLATHFDSMEVSVPGAPGVNEIVVIFALTNGGRPHPWDGWK
ncbi:MAG: amino acid synthesis family protein [Anaerolineae bacterium]|nr:amino acid synthesis family protein [Anaerolineae bacterium]